jgi:hypothetical protein
VLHELLVNSYTVLKFSGLQVFRNPENLSKLKKPESGSTVY